MATRSASKRLGRGLDSLISRAPSAASGTTGDTPRTYFECETALIDAMEGQPRRRFDTDALDELAESIRQSGIIQPLVVRQAEGGRYALIAGERRLRAARRAGLAKVPVVIRDVTDSDAFALALVENIQREDLNPIEEAIAFERLLDEHGFTHEALAEKLGKSRTALTNGVRLLKLSSAVQELVADGSLSAGHARAVLSVPDELQAMLAERIITEGLSVRASERLAKEWKEQGPGGTSESAPQTESKNARPTDPPLRPQLQLVRNQLRDRFGTRVELKQKADGRGVVEIHFADDQGLQAILDVLE